MDPPRDPPTEAARTSRSSPAAVRDVVRQPETAPAWSSRSAVSLDLGINTSDASFRVPKRKRLAKACNACHKSKRRCDGYEPCGNCYFASKECVYTDASGAPVSAPFGRPLGREAVPGPSGASTSPITATPASSASPMGIPGPGPGSAKKQRGTSRPTDTSPPGTEHAGRKPYHGSDKQVAGPHNHSSGIHPSLARELINLFFAHSHPQCLIIHRPSFDESLRRGSVPHYLLLAILALASIHSKHPAVRTNPPRCAGRQFARDAKTMMFDDEGRLIVESNLATAQALCLLEMHTYVSHPDFLAGRKYHTLAMHILDSLGFLEERPDNQSNGDPLEIELGRRTFWLIYLLDLLAFIYIKAPTPDFSRRTHIPLPVDETSFDFASTALPEYLDTLPTPNQQQCSEFGHLLRIVHIKWRLEHDLRELSGARDPRTTQGALAMGRQAVEAWAASVPLNLVYSNENLQMQMAMFETGSNGGAWCYCLMHVMHASCVISLDIAFRRHTPVPITQWAVDQIFTIINAVGQRARNSVLLAFALWSLSQYYGENHPILAQWSAHFQELWELKIDALAASMHRQSQLDESGRAGQTELPQPHPAPHLDPSLINPAAAQYGGGQGRRESTLAPRPHRGTSMPPIAGPSSSRDADVGRVRGGMSAMEQQLHSRRGAVPIEPINVTRPSLPSLRDSGLLTVSPRPSQRQEPPGSQPQNPRQPGASTQGEQFADLGLNSVIAN
ncbi:hypothetical protein PUNSTDRAFT_139113 [Punctularia strigosozonata HHB-11173 SS5]|uniref:Zn(2)-C6 fungal-type domain-containing protein n=1 Tax=Punctularia strigosozonata (strain HHB-11173) TaxID=741275 RepID=R7S0S4_PUNST|nr:uncharacterized protein PUNSTDRAFT_139113 [Punctularia strigosozonata HHB-11173 SS5]EIN03808.1 hypothetical protein PUNSTDRAFT_139113 [Punctularia strigosozonata HHB-11173 SS5]